MPDCDAPSNPNQYPHDRDPFQELLDAAGDIVVRDARITLGSLAFDRLRVAVEACREITYRPLPGAAGPSNSAAAGPGAAAAAAEGVAGTDGPVAAGRRAPWQAPADHLDAFWWRRLRASLRLLIGEVEATATSDAVRALTAQMALVVCQAEGTTALADELAQRARAEGRA